MIDDAFSAIFSQIKSETVQDSNCHEVDDVFSALSINDIKGKKDSDSRRKLESVKNPRCSDCDVDMYKLGLEYICSECGRTEEIVGGSTDIAEKNNAESVSDYNTSNNSSAPVRISGPGSYAFQRKLVSTTSNYKVQQKRNTYSQMRKIICEYKGDKPSEKIIKEACEFYYQVQQHRIKRGDVRKGTMAACLYRKCIENQVVRKPKEIASMFGIPQRELSNGEKILDELFSEGLLGTATDVEAGNASAGVDQFCLDEEKIAKDFLFRYFELLNIPTVHITFAYRLIRFTTSYHIAESSVVSSKCAGTVYIIAKQKSMKITKKDIITACNLSFSTFNRFYKEVVEFLHNTQPNKTRAVSRMKKIFKVGDIPIPME
jgi:transcription initiation factor TFIIIB Brf1 subunit/transcription initiation factor TFIIB